MFGQNYVAYGKGETMILICLRHLFISTAEGSHRISGSHWPSAEMFRIRFCKIWIRVLKNFDPVFEKLWTGFRKTLIWFSLSVITVFSLYYWIGYIVILFRGVHQLGTQFRAGILCFPPPWESFFFKAKILYERFCHIKNRFYA